MSNIHIPQRLEDESFKAYKKRREESKKAIKKIKLGTVIKEMSASARANIRNMQKERKGQADKAAAKRMGWPKSLRQYSSVYGQGADIAESLRKQMGN
jgi:hypothetical protein